MSERLNKIFNNERSRTKFIAYFVGCHPTYEKSLEIIKAAIDNGVSIVEVGYSTSEASAEGPVIKAAQDRVIANGSSLQDVIKLAKEIRSYNKNVGIILMGYISNIFMFPIPNFISEIKKKLYSYKSQDKIKGKYDEEQFITYDELIQKLCESNLICYYCNKDLYITNRTKKEPYQWSLERFDNNLGHYNSNTCISCLKCNLQRRTDNHEYFKMSKNMKISKVE